MAMFCGWTELFFIVKDTLENKEYYDGYKFTPDVNTALIYNELLSCVNDIDNLRLLYVNDDVRGDII